METFYKFTSLLVMIVIVLQIQLQAQSDVRLYKLKAIEGSNDVYKASNLIWEEDGKETNLFEKADGRTIIMSFWGTWCGYCMRHLPELAKLYNTLPKDKYYFINAVCENTPATVGAAEQVIADNEVYFDNVWYAFSDAKNMQVHNYYNVTKFISTLVISPEKQVLKEIHDVIYDSFLDSLSLIMSAEREVSITDGGITISPNPVSTIALISYNLEKPADVNLRVFNSIGCEIAALTERNDNVGTKSIVFNCENFTPGVYYYILNIEGTAHSGKFVVAR